MTALSLSCIWGKTVAIKDMQTLRDEGRVATNLTGAELLLCEQSGLSKVLTLDTIHDWLESKCGCAGGGAGNLCHFGRIGSELGMTEPEPTFAEPEDWEAGRIRWNSAGTALLVDVYGHAAHFDQLDVVIRIYACKAGADVLTQNPDGSRILLYSYAVPESAVLSSSGGLVGTGTAISGFACNEIAHTKEPNSEYGFINFSSIEDAATCCWHGTAEIPAEHLSAFNSNFPDDNHLQILAAVIYADQVPIQNPENGLFTHGGILCGSMVLEIPENTAGDCTPDSASAPGAYYDPVPGLSVGDTVYATASINGAAAQTVAWVVEYDTYGELLHGLCNALALSYVRGSGGIADWFVYHGTIHGGDGTAGDPAMPVTVALMLDTNPAHLDAVELLFGEAITLHSCGAQYWPGL